MKGHASLRLSKYLENERARERDHLLHELVLFSVQGWGLRNEWQRREERGKIWDRAGRHEGSTSCGRKERKGGEGSELSFSAPEADTFADTRHDHPLGVLRIFQWKFCVKGTPPRADTNIAFRSPLLLRFSMRNLPDLKQYPVRNAIYSNFLSPASCPLFFSNVLFQFSFFLFFASIHELELLNLKWNCTCTGYSLWILLDIHFSISSFFLFYA